MIQPDMLLIDFPNLSPDECKEKSPDTTKYNCIAWAAGDNTRRWDPDPVFQNFYWPDGVPREQTIEAFVLVFEQLKYEECDTGQVESGFEKVAIYTRYTTPQHVARQLENGLWTSKLGDDIDINHTLSSLESDLYGTVTKFMKRRRS